jgi:hypothetical protein
LNKRPGSHVTVLFLTPDEFWNFQNNFFAKEIFWLTSMADLSKVVNWAKRSVPGLPNLWEPFWAEKLFPDIYEKWQLYSLWNFI